MTCYYDDYYCVFALLFVPSKKKKFKFCFVVVSDTFDLASNLRHDLRKRKCLVNFHQDINSTPLQSSLSLYHHPHLDTMQSTQTLICSRQTCLPNLAISAHYSTRSNLCRSCHISSHIGGTEVLHACSFACFVAVVVVAFRHSVEDMLHCSWTTLTTPVDQNGESVLGHHCMVSSVRH